MEVEVVEGRQLLLLEPILTDAAKPLNHQGRLAAQWLFAGRNSAGTHSAVLHQLEAGAEVGQADVAVHVQQDVVRLDVPERRKTSTASDVFRFIYFLQTKK